MHFSIESKIIRGCFKKLGFKKIKLLFYLYNNDMNEHFIIFFLVCILLHHKIVIKNVYGICLDLKSSMNLLPPYLY